MSEGGSDREVDTQLEAAARRRRLAPGARELAKPVLQSILTAAAKAQLGR